MHEAVSTEYVLDYGSVNTACTMETHLLPWSKSRHTLHDKCVIRRDSPQREVDHEYISNGETHCDWVWEVGLIWTHGGRPNVETVRMGLVVISNVFW